MGLRIVSLCIKLILAATAQQAASAFKMRPRLNQWIKQLHPFQIYPDTR